MRRPAEHILLARQVGCPTFMVYLNKADMVGRRRAAGAGGMEVRELLSATTFRETTSVITGSALKALEGIRASWANPRSTSCGGDGRLTSATAARGGQPFPMPLKTCSRSPGGHGSHRAH